MTSCQGAFAPNTKLAARSGLALDLLTSQQTSKFVSGNQTSAACWLEHHDKNKVFFLKACTRLRKGWCSGFQALEKQSSVFPFCHYSSETLQVNKSHLFTLTPLGDTGEDWIMAEFITSQVSHKVGLICIAQMYICRNRYFKEFYLLYNPPTDGQVPARKHSTVRPSI